MTDRHRALIVNAALAMAVWTSWLGLGGADAVRAVQEHWPVTITMVFGSIVAGATSEGGGAVAFPIFTKVLGIPPHEARVFALAIQSVGMTAASIAILVLRVRVSWPVLVWAGLGGVFGIVLSTFLIVPVASAAVVRVAFTTMVGCLGLALAFLNDARRSARNEQLPGVGRQESGILVATGLAGGAMSGLVGTGIDIVTFMTMVLLFRLDEKVATPTSVLLMTGNTLIGFALHLFLLDTFTPAVAGYWLAAVPVVVVGAPLGAYLCSVASRRTIAQVLMALILLEVVSTLVVVPMSATLAGTATVTMLFVGFLHAMMCSSRRYVPPSAF